MEKHERRVGTVSRGIRCPIIRENDDLAKIVADSVLEAAEYEDFEIRDKDVISITESIVARAQGNYASVEDIAADVKAKLGGGTVGVIFPILSRNRFAICLRGIAMGAKKIVLMLSYPSDEVGNQLVSLDKIDAAGVNPYSDVLDEKRYRELLYHNRAILARVRFSGIKLRRYDWGSPYLSKDRCRYIRGARYDNGRVMNAEFLETTITDVDFKIIEEEYEWESVRFVDTAYTYYGMLPESFRNIVIEYYRRKTALKGIKDKELDYYRSKAKLNSLYGMTAQDPCKVPIIFEDNMLDFDEGADLAEILAKDNRRRQLPPYQIGVWVTAWAREELEEGIRKVYDTEGAYFIYTDTDSIKYIGDVDWTDYNDERIRRSTASGAFADDPKGVRHYMGVFEYEGSAAKFVTLGAKKYCYEDQDGHLHLTVAGVVKKAGAKELEEHGGIKAFKPTFIFNTSGGVEAVYNDKPDMRFYAVDGHMLEITSNVVLRPSTYTLGITNEYEYLLSISKLYELEE